MGYFSDNYDKLRFPTADGPRPEFRTAQVAAAHAVSAHLHRESGRWEADAFGKGATPLLRFAGGLPLAVSAGEAARIDHAIGGAIQHLEVVLPEIALVRPAIERSRPRAFEDSPIEREVLLRGHAGVDIVQPQSP